MQVLVYLFMLTGIRLQAHPNALQKQKLSQWMGCARYIWNAKCIQDKEQRQLLFESGTYPKIDASYAHFKDKEQTSWLYDCPSVILRNSISNWKDTYQNFFKKLCGRPQKKKRDGRGSIHLTREVFNFVKGEDGVTRLFVGTKKHPIGYLSLKNHRSYKIPNSIYIKKKHDQYWVSFCYESIASSPALTDKQHLASLRKKGEEYLTKQVLGIDRGIARPVQGSNSQVYFELTAQEKAKKIRIEKQRLRYQKKLSRQQKGSNRRYLTKVRLSKRHEKIANIRNNFCHQTSYKLVHQKDTQVFIFEDLGTKRMTKRPKPKQDSKGKWLKNKASAKAGLNKAILDKSWHLLEVFTKYKAKNMGKVVFKVSAHYTSQECANCHHIHPDNRKSQSKFSCVHCGHTDNADHNAALVIKHRAIQLILNSGTELSKRGVLSLSDSGRGADVSRGNLRVSSCSGEEASKKKVAMPLEAPVL